MKQDKVGWFHCELRESRVPNKPCDLQCGACKGFLAPDPEPKTPPVPGPQGLPKPAHSGSKYLRPIRTDEGRADVYDVLVAFGVTCPARAHAIKKLLCAGIRGKGSQWQDLSEAADAVKRSIELLDGPE